MTPKRQRLIFLFASLLLLGLASALILNAFSRNLIYFYTPTDILASPPAPEQAVRLGGLVKKSSIRHKGKSVSFLVTDGVKDIPVSYMGLLPNLFREGQGVIAEGMLPPDGIFRARSILAKHDENYMPPEVARRLKDMGHWKTDYRTVP